MIECYVLWCYDMGFVVDFSIDCVYLVIVLYEFRDFFVGVCRYVSV